MAVLEKHSPCKVNLLLNILGKRADGFHELETLFHPVALFDTIEFERTGTGLTLSCDDPCLPTGQGNLVYRAAALFLEKAGISEGVSLRLHKRIPMAAGLGGGSGNAATTLLGLNELFGFPLEPAVIYEITTRLGSDISFFLQPKPALAFGRGEKIQPVDSFSILNGTAFVLVHPGFGISTPWAYQQLGNFPDALNGEPGRAESLVHALQKGDLKAAADLFYNSLEAPALHKYPILQLYQRFFRENGALATLMSGSGSTTFAIAASVADGHQLSLKFREKFGEASWIKVVPISHELL
jgi:4-diphosphocytidyl-2-C-methyl-D-erythritol kinase